MNEHPDYTEVVQELDQATRDSATAMKRLCLRINGDSSPQHAYTELGNDIRTLKATVDRLLTHYLDLVPSPGKVRVRQFRARRAGGKVRDIDKEGAR